LPDSENLKDEVLTYFKAHFGVAQEVLSLLTFQEKDKEIWAASAPLPEGIFSRRPSGLRILRRISSGLKPTSTVLQLLGDHITASRVEMVDVKELRMLLLGQTLPVDVPDGFVAIVFRRDVLGCGVVKGKRLRVLIPTAKRRDLLETLKFETRC